MAETHPIHRMAKYIFEQVYQQAGIASVFTTVPNKRSLIIANDGGCAAEVGRISRATEVFKNLRVVPTPFYNLRGFAFSRKDRDLKIEKWEDLKGLRIAIRRGEIYAAEATKEFTPIKIGNYPAMFNLVENGGVDVAIGLWVSALDVLSKPENKFHIERSTGPLHEEPFYHLVHKDFPDLNMALNSVLMEWQKSGKLKQTVDAALEKLANGDI